MKEDDEDMTVFAFYLFAICVIAGGLFTVISKQSGAFGAVVDPVVPVIGRIVRAAGR